MSSYKLNNTDIRSLPIIPPAFFATFTATGAAGGGTGISAALQNIGITLGDYLPLAEGVVVKNMNTTASTLLRVYENVGYTGTTSNRYLLVSGLDEVFIGTTNPANIFVRNNVAAPAGITVGIYAR